MVTCASLHINWKFQFNFRALDLRSFLFIFFLFERSLFNLLESVSDFDAVLVICSDIGHLWIKTVTTTTSLSVQLATMQG